MGKQGPTDHAPRAGESSAAGDPKRQANTPAFGLYQIDTDGRLLTVNDRLLEMTGRTRGSLLGSRLSAVFGPEISDGSEADQLHVQTVLSAPEREGDPLPCRVQQAALEDGGAVGVVSLEGSMMAESGRRQVAGETKGESQGQCQAEPNAHTNTNTQTSTQSPTATQPEILERIDDAFYSVDTDWRFTYANDAIAALASCSPEALIGAKFWEMFPETIGTAVERQNRTAMGSGEPACYTVSYEPTDSLVEVRAYPSATGLSVSCRDVTAERTLETTLQKNSETVQQLYAISEDRDRSFGKKVTDLLALGCEYLDLEAGFLAAIDRSVGRFEIVESSGDLESVQPGSVAPLEETYCRRTIEEDGLLGVYQASTEGWATDPAYERYDYDCYLGGKVTVDGDLYGTLCFCARSPRKRPFSTAERTFVELLTQWASYELERVTHHQQLEDQRRQLATLNRQNALVQTIAHDLIGTTSRAELETVVCDRLVASKQYDTAWVGRFDGGQTTLTPTVCLDTGGELECCPIDVATESELGSTLEDVLASGEPTVVDEPCRKTGFELPDVCLPAPVAIVPVCHDGRAFGVLCLGSDRPSAFGDHELKTLWRLGDVIGHAITAIERKAALSSQRVTAVELRSKALAKPFVEAATTEADGEGRHAITVDRVVPLEDETTLMYQTVSDVDAESYLDGVSALPAVDGARILEAGITDTRFEICLSGPTIASAAVAYSGWVRSIEIGSTLSVMVDLPVEADTRQFVETVRDSYPNTDIELHSKQQVDRHPQSAAQFQTAVANRLTEKQRLALETSYFAGFFEWPRETTGEAVADAIGVSPATYHQHLREGERRLLDAFFPDDDSADSPGQ